MGVIALSGVDLGEGVVAKEGAAEGMIAGERGGVDAGPEHAVTISRMASTQASMGDCFILQNQHGIPEAVEAVSLVDGFLVGPPRKVFPGKSGDQHK